MRFATGFPPPTSPGCAQRIFLQPVARLGASVFLLLLFESVSVSAKDKPKPPDMTRVIRLAGRFNMAHACPIASDLAVTCAHVVDRAPLDMSVPPFPMRYDTATEAGFADVLLVSNADDLAYLAIPNHPFYPIAPKAPAVGEMLFFLNYDYRKPETVLRPVIASGEVVNIVAGHIYVDTKVFPGASGGCLLNAKGEAVGIAALRFELDNTNTVLGGPAIWGHWLDPSLAKIKKMREEQGEN